MKLQRVSVSNLDRNPNDECENPLIVLSKREQVRANLRRHVKRVLRKYGYPPDKTERAAETVIEQAELLEREAA